MARFLLAFYYRQGVSNLRELELTGAWKTLFPSFELEQELHRMAKFAMPVKFFESWIEGKREEDGGEMEGTRGRH